MFMMHSVNALFDATAAHFGAASIVAQEQSGPLGADFGKASPIGLFVIVIMLIVILALGWDMTRRAKRMAKRRKFAEEHDMDPFETEAIDAAMAKQARESDL